MANFPAIAPDADSMPQMQIGDGAYGSIQGYVPDPTKCFVTLRVPHPTHGGTTGGQPLVQASMRLSDLINYIVATAKGQ